VLAILGLVLGLAGVARLCSAPGPTADAALTSAARHP